MSGRQFCEFSITGQWIVKHKDTESNYSNLKYRHAYMIGVLIIEKTIWTTLTKLTLHLFSVGRVLQLGYGYRL